ncbi:MAG: hypothetical protein ACRD5J_14195 [Nitrososphaeraceae archaeon]
MAKGCSFLAVYPAMLVKQKSYIPHIVSSILENVGIIFYCNIIRGDMVVGQVLLLSFIPGLLPP